jgi:3'5'-cyclic nucleotide phosphodiesterase
MTRVTHVLILWTCPTKCCQSEAIEGGHLRAESELHQLCAADNADAFIASLPSVDWHFQNRRNASVSEHAGPAVANHGTAVRARRKSLLARSEKPDAIWSIIADPIAKQLLLASESLNTWNAFKLAKATKHRPLATFALWCLQRSGLMAHFNIPEDRLTAMMSHVESHYPDNPYHNRVHAADVMRSIHFLLTVTPAGLLDAEQRLALYIGAAAHDVEHGGVTNSFLCATNVRTSQVSECTTATVPCACVQSYNMTSFATCRTSLLSRITMRLH